MDLKNNFHKKVLSNGMTILFEKRAVPVVSVAFAVRYGGVNEDVSEKGIAHFIEHMLYKGTPTRNSKKIAEEIEKNGGELNGFTSEVLTAYWCKMPSQKLNIALGVLGDMIRNPLFDEKELEKERQVIFEEIKMYKDNPRMYVFKGIQKNLFTGTMGMNLAGTFDTMNLIDREKILKKFKEIYTPNNMILVVVGDADFDVIVDYVEENFIDGKKNIVSKQKFDFKNSEQIEERGEIDQANLVFAYHVPTADDDKSDAAVVLNTLLADGMSSRLFVEIREKRNLAYAVKGGSEIAKQFAYNIVYVGTMKENVEQVKELILKEFEDVAKNLEEDELNSVKEQMIGQWQIGMEDSQTQLVGLLMEEINGKAENYYDYEKKIRAVNLENVKNLAKTATEKFSFYALVPKE